MEKKCNIELYTLTENTSVKEEQREDRKYKLGTEFVKQN